MKSTTVDTTQFRDLVGQSAGTPARAFSRLGSAMLVRHKLLASSALGLLLGLSYVADAQEYAFTRLDVPGAARTAANGNSTTAVAGEFDDANGNTHGFLLSKG